MPIRTLGDPVLREPAKQVTVFDGRLRTLRDAMVETMYEAPGVGLAGPQVGISLRLFVLDDSETGPLFIANPDLVDAHGELLEEEGCLSIPGPYHETKRSSRITCRGQDIEGAPFEITGDGLLARILQHETDHLDGMLYIDRLDDEGRRSVMAQLRRIELGLEEPPPSGRSLRGDDP